MRDQISAALKEALKNQDKRRIATLRLINAAIKDQDIARRGADGDTDLTDADIMAILGKMTKQRQESVRAYEEGGRLDLAEREQREIEIIAEYLPRPLDESEVDAAIDKAIKDTGATSIRDMGKIMGRLKEKYTGQMDFGMVGPKVKERLA